jgi:adenosylhomocysteine nucleosidase
MLVLMPDHLASTTHLILALPMESQGLFEAAAIPVSYCGLGKVNAASKAAELIHKFGASFILNLGTAGSEVFPTHSLVECSAVVQRDMDTSPLGFPVGETPMDPIGGRIDLTEFFPDLPKGVCGTGDNFETGAPKIPCDLVDMEAYAIAKVCRQNGVGFAAVKYIADGCDHNAHNDWQENLIPGARALLEVYGRFKASR